ncbi:11365_t:CDS:1, partial [Acaulospora morrowiae]
NYDDNLKSLKKISESIKKHKKDLIKGRETMPSKEVEYEKYKGKSESCSKNSEKFIYLGAGLAFCNTFYIITILLDGRMGFLTAYSSIFLMTIISLFVLFLGVKFRFDSTEYSKVSEEIKVNLDVIKRLIENTNDTEIKAIELNVVSLIRRIPVVLEYWKDYKESLEGLIVVFNAGGHNFDPSQMGDKWREIKNCLEDYGHIVRDVLEQNDLLNGKDSKNN